MSGKTVRKVLFGVVVAVLLLASFFAGRMHQPAMNVQAQDEVDSEDRGTVWHDCAIIEVALFGNRAHIRCSNVKTVGSDSV